MTKPTLNYGTAGRQIYVRYYRHTGRASFLSVVVPLLIGSCISIALAWLYIRGMRWIGSIYLIALFPVVYGGFIGLMMTVMLYAGHVRNRIIWAGLLLLVTLIGYYATWYWFMFGEVGDSVRPGFRTYFALGHPKFLWTFAQYKSEVGTWFIGRESTVPMRGWLVWLSWAAELLAVIGASIAAAKATTERRIYCEHCRDWCEVAVPLLRMKAESPDEARTRLEALDASYFLHLADNPPSDHYWSLQCEACSKCDVFAALSIVDVSVRNTNQGIPSLKRRVIVDRMIVEGDTLIEFLSSIAPNDEEEHPPEQTE